MIKTKTLDQNKFLIISYLLLYASLVIGFFFGEDLNSGATADWYKTDFPVIRDLTVNIKETLLNYESYGHRHSPVYLIFLSLFVKAGLSFDAVRFLHLNFSIFLIYFFYKCLVLKFDKIDKNLLIILSISIFFSPTFRSLAIWPSTTIIGLIFFVISIYEFLKFKKNPSINTVWKNLIYLIIASYISPNFSLFILYFFYHYLKKLNFKTIILISTFCFILALPAFYYLFILEINFLSPGTPGIAQDTNKLSFNFSNKILIIGSIILFHLIPFIINKNFFIEFVQSFKKNIVIVSIFFLLNLFFFNYNLHFTGGGVFLQISNLFFKNNLFFYFFSFTSLLLIGYFIRKNLNNFIILFLLIVSNIQYTIYHKYYEPLIMILFFTIFNDNLIESFFKKKVNFIYLYVFYLIYILMRIFKNKYFI